MSGTATRRPGEPARTQPSAVSADPQRTSSEIEVEGPHDARAEQSGSADG